ncbi:MAG: oligopeptide transporter, OPT family [Deltaproteobacteria bacterium]|nr:oligopeptide transporter, OPT family [Deltaproteobacteria bacterium]
MGTKFEPFVPEAANQREFTFRALVLGVLMAVILGAANAYLGLKAGMTVAATFPAAVVGMAVLKLFNGSILEENITRTVASVGEALVAGAIFTIPAFVIAGPWKDNFGSTERYFESTSIMLVGGVLGVLFVTVLRRIMVQESDLPFPESVAAAEIHKAGRSGGTGAKYVFGAMGIGALIQLFAKMKVFAVTWERFIPFSRSSVKFVTSKGENIGEVLGGGGAFVSSFAISPAYLGVGVIIGPKLSAIAFSGGVLAWGLFVPLLLYFTGPTTLQQWIGLPPAGAPGGAPVDWSMLSIDVWKFMVRPIAVGGMLVGAVYTLYGMRKELFGGIARAVRDLKKIKTGTGDESRLDKDLDFRWIFATIGLLIIAMVGLYMYFTGSFLGSLVSALVMAVAGFLFAAVAGYLVGLIGSSNNPISGLTLSTVIIAALLMVGIGLTGEKGIVAVLAVAAVVCCTCGVAGDMLQDLKVGHLLGGTPWKMEAGEIIGVIFAAAVMFFPLYILHQGDILAGGTGFGGKNLPAPQAGLMAMLAEGIVAGKMAWPLVISGMLMAVGLILVGAPSPMLIAVGMYLPLETTFAIFIGGIVRLAVDRAVRKKGMSQEQAVEVENTGVLLSSGFIAGEALMGLFVAALAFASIKLPAVFEHPSFIVGLFFLALLIGMLYYIPLKRAQK